MEENKEIARLEPSDQILMMNSLVLSTPSWIDVTKKSSMNFNRVKMCVGEILEDVLKEYLSLRYASLSKAAKGEPFLPGFEFFDDVDDSRYFTKKVFLKDTGVKWNNYDDFKKLVLNLYKIGVSVPIKGKDGVEYIQFRSLFVGAVPKVKKVNYVLISIDKEAVNKSLGQFLGYSGVYSSTIKRYSPTAHVQSTYFFLKGHKDKFTCKLSEYKKFLGIPSDAYPALRSFKSYVLEKTCKEMKEMYDRGQSDIYFDYELSDTKITFTRHDSKLLSKINLADAILSLERREQDFYKRLLRNGVGEKSALALSKKLTDYNYSSAVSKLVSLEDAVTKGNVEKSGAYIYSSMDKFFENMSKEEADIMSKPPRERWAICLVSMCREVSQDVCNKVFSQIGFKSYNEGSLVLSIPSAKLMDTVESDYLTLFSRCIHKYFGRKVQLSYFIPKSDK